MLYKEWMDQKSQYKKGNKKEKKKEERKQMEILGLKNTTAEQEEALSYTKTVIKILLTSQQRQYKQQQKDEQSL